jgi:hypothetical protein
MSDKKKGIELLDEKQVTDILSESLRLYNTYLELTSYESLIDLKEEPEVIEPSWDHPLTLSFKSHR